MTVLFTADGCEVRDEEKNIIATGVPVNGMYKLNTKLVTDVDLWHRRLGHLNHQCMRRLTTMVDGMQLGEGSSSDCVACAQGKHTRSVFSSSASRAEGLLDLVHSDVCGPMAVQSIGASVRVLHSIQSGGRGSLRQIQSHG